MDYLNPVVAEVSPNLYAAAKTAGTDSVQVAVGGECDWRVAEGV